MTVSPSAFIKGAGSLLAGLGVTIRAFFQPVVTSQYPRQLLNISPRFRSHTKLVADRDNPDKNACTACQICVKACPSNCIALENAVSEAGKKVAKVAWYSIDFGKCNFCRLCEESCPTKPKSVWHSLDYEVIFVKRDEMVRCWKKDFPFIGKYFDRKAQDFQNPQGQVSFHDVSPRRS